jgi:alpha-beta hydrolase superfamily lysophospholipase
MKREEGFLERSAGVRLYHCEWWPEPASDAGAALVLMHGYAVRSRRYDELAEYLVQRGSAVCRRDARGEGRSNGQRGYIERFEQYTDDLHGYVEHIRALAPGRPLALLGHSNGGLIAVRALQQGLAGVSALVLTNPLIELRPARRPVPELVARWLSRAAPRLPLPNGLRVEALTRDEGLRAAARSDPWIHHRATPRWYWSALCEGRAALEQAAKLALPLLVIVGEADPIVEPSAVQALYERAAAPDKQLWSRPGELHEVLNELGRRELFERIAEWLGQRWQRALSSPAPPPAPRP